ncbi:MAG: J domain-containing protein, partial [Beijerinckiaceae bacterium]
MNLNSPLFDRIRVKSGAQEESPPASVACDHPGCGAAGEYRAPKGRNREGQYFCFCLDHVRAYNQSYNYFTGMTDEDVAKYQKEAVIGHRPTWTMGVKRGKGFREEGADPADFVDPFGVMRGRAQARRAAPPQPPPHGVA